MEIDIRKIDKDYVNITIEHWGTKIELWFHTKDDAVKLRSIFENAVDELSDFIGDKQD